MGAVEERCLVLSENGGFLSWIPYDEVHTNGLRHLTVQLIPVQPNREKTEVHILVHRRSAGRTVGANQLDFCGGHVRFDERYLQLDTLSPEFLRTASDDAALEETREEVVCDPTFEFGLANLHRFRTVGEFHVDTTSNKGGRNVEDSTAYFIAVPSGRVVRVREVVRGDTTWVDPDAFTVDALLAKFRKNEADFSDGASRILKIVSKDSTVEQAFRDSVNSVNAK